jgi:hypothetical protein
VESVFLSQQLRGSTVAGGMTGAEMIVQKHKGQGHARVAISLAFKNPR